MEERNINTDELKKTSKRKRIGSIVKNIISIILLALSFVYCYGFTHDIADTTIFNLNEQLRLSEGVMVSNFKLWNLVYLPIIIPIVLNATIILMWALNKKKTIKSYIYIFTSSLFLGICVLSFSSYRDQVRDEYVNHVIQFQDRLELAADTYIHFEKEKILSELSNTDNYIILTAQDFKDYAKRNEEFVFDNLDHYYMESGLGNCKYYVRIRKDAFDELYSGAVVGCKGVFKYPMGYSSIKYVEQDIKDYELDKAN